MKSKARGIRRLSGDALYVFAAFAPWPIRRWLLEQGLGYDIHPTARIGVSWVRPERLVLSAYARIGHLNVCKGMELLSLGEHSSIGRLNWLTGFPTGHPIHFAAESARNPSFVMGKHSAITHRHIVDCTNAVRIGDYVTLAGFRSQILTHSIDIETAAQRSQPVCLGDYTFIGTGVTILAGSVLPSKSVLGAGSVLTRSYDQEGYLYAGVPARPVKALDSNLAYFARTKGSVD